MKRPLNLTGQRFGRLVALTPGPRHGRLTTWLCACDCGEKAVVTTKSLRGGRTQSCGCLMREKSREMMTEMSTSHGMSRSRTYRCWINMKVRCSDPTHDAYANYGGRGIKVCERWGSFENFYADMGKRPKGGTIDRIDPDGNYEPGNCKWASNLEQQRNKTNNRLVTFRGETKCLSEWADDTGINYSTLQSRLRHGWPLHRSLTEEVN